MTDLTERGKAFEAEYSRRQDVAFRINARRNRLFGLWAAAKMGLGADEAIETYARTVVVSDFEAPGDDDVIAKVRADLAAKGITVTEAELRTELERAGAKARKQILEPGSGSRPDVPTR